MNQSILWSNQLPQLSKESSEWSLLPWGEVDVIPASSAAWSETQS